MSDEEIRAAFFGTNNELKLQILEHQAHIKLLETQVAALRKMVKNAYNDGVLAGMREVNSSKGGTPWSECKYRAALEEK